MYQLNTFGLTQLNVKEAIAFYINLQKNIRAATPAAIGISEALVNKYDQDLTSLIDQVYYVRSSVHTTTMEEADRRRCDIYRRINLRLQLVCYGDDVRSLKTARTAVETYILSRYEGSVIAMAKQERSAVISGFITDLRAKLTEDDIDALGIDNDISALDSANNAFIVAYSDRVKERSLASRGVTAQLRSAMAETYRQLTTVILFYANADEPDLAAKTTACQSFLSGLNVLTSEARTRYLARISHSSKGKDTDANATPPSHNTPAQQPDTVQTEPKAEEKEPSTIPSGNEYPGNSSIEA